MARKNTKGVSTLRTLTAAQAVKAAHARAATAATTAARKPGKATDVLRAHPPVDPVTINPAPPHEGPAPGTVEIQIVTPAAMEALVNAALDTISTLVDLPSGEDPMAGIDLPGADQDATKAEHHDTTPVAPLSFVLAPANFLRAAAACVSKDKERANIQGIYIHAKDGALRVVATDGSRLFVGASTPSDLPEWLDQGVILPPSAVKGFLAFTGTDFLRIGFATDAPRVQFADLEDNATYRVYPMTETFPGYEGILNAASGNFDDTKRVALDAISFEGKHLKEAGALANLLGASALNLMAPGSDAKPYTPSVITFAGTPGAVLYLVPAAQEHNGPISAETASILAPALKGTVAALRAHQTRWEKAAARAKPGKDKDRAAFLASGFAQRVAAILAGTTKALPAPSAPAAEGDGETPAEEPEPAAPYAIAQAIGPASRLVPRDYGTWLESVACQVKAKNGGELPALPDVPTRDWFDAGMPAATAATRTIAYAKTN